MKNEKITREFIEQTMKQLDAKSKKTVGRKALAQFGIKQHHINEFIPEGLTQLKADLGLKISPQERQLSDSELLEQLDRLVSESKQIPTWAKIRRITRITDKVFRKRFGGIHAGSWA